MVQPREGGGAFHQPWEPVVGQGQAQGGPRARDTEKASRTSAQACLRTRAQLGVSPQSSQSLLLLQKVPLSPTQDTTTGQVSGLQARGAGWGGSSVQEPAGS